MRRPEPAVARPRNVPAKASAVSVRSGPRERLAEGGIGGLSDAELLGLILRTGPAREGAVELGRRCLEGLGGLSGLAAAPLPSIQRVRGLGPAKAASLQAAFELGRRAASRPLRRGDRMGGPGDIHRAFMPGLRLERRESFFAILLDARHRVLGRRPVSLGTLTASLVHPREVFREVIREAAAALVVVHNHPSGDPAPSAEDHEVTERLRKAGELLGIPLVDHVIVADSGFFSFRETYGPELVEALGRRGPR